jgi:hypothetical protein
MVAMGQAIYTGVQRFHGAVGREWEHLVNLQPTEIQEQVNLYRDAWLSHPDVKAIRDSAHLQVASVINCFALMAADLRMAIDANLLPWNAESADAGILACANRWAEQRGDLCFSGETIRATNKLRTGLIESLKNHFVELKFDEKGVLKHVNNIPTHLLYGYVKPDRICIYPNAWRTLTWGTADVGAYLLSKDWLIPASGKRTAGKPRSERIGQGKPTERFYVLKREFLKED